MPQVKNNIDNNTTFKFEGEEKFLSTNSRSEINLLEKIKSERSQKLKKSIIRYIKCERSQNNLFNIFRIRYVKKLYSILKK